MNGARSRCRMVLSCFSVVFILIASFHVLHAGDNPWSHLRQAPQGGYLAWERRPVEGFAWPASVAPNQQIKFYVSIQNINGGHRYRIEIFRLPDLNAVLWTSSDTVGSFYPLRDASGTPMPARRPIRLEPAILEKCVHPAGNLPLRVVDVLYQSLDPLDPN